MLRSSSLSTLEKLRGGLAIASAIAFASCTGGTDTPPSAITKRGGEPSEPPSPVAKAAAPVTAIVKQAAAAVSNHVRVDGHAFPDKVIALTWDDGPDRNTLELAEYLKRHRISATFFVVSEWVNGLSDEPGNGQGVYESGYQYLPVLGDLVGLGHRVANHTLNHALLREALGASLLDRELRVNQRNLDPYLTNELRLFRAPGGGWGSFGMGIVDKDPYLSTMVGPVAWDIDRKDWEESLACRGPQSARECEPHGPGGALRMKPAVVAARYVATIESAGHGIVLLHDRVGHVGSTYGFDVAQAMIPQLEAKGFVFAAPVLAFSPLVVREHDGEEPISEAHHWEPSTVRLGDINGDGREDICGRAPAGVTCAISVQSTYGSNDRLPRTVFKASRNSTSPTQTQTTPAGAIRLADVTGDGQADVCVAAADGLRCAASNVVGELGEFHTWSSSDHAASLRFADVDGDGRADACSRTADGIACARSLGRQLDEPSVWLADMSDAHGWGAPEYASTVQLADVDGDGRADVCGRGPKGIQCALSNGKGFSPLTQFSSVLDFADDGAWNTNPAFYGSLRFGDLNGDGREDVCGLGPTGIVCALSTGRSFTRATVWIAKDATDAEGWTTTEAAATLSLGDINGDGRADLCGRGKSGIVCGMAP